jgi:hypothetical protein
MLALRQALEQPNTVTLGAQTIDVIENYRRVQMFPEVAVVLPLNVTSLDPL